MVDQDYFNQLNEAELAFLVAFNQANFGADVRPLEKLTGEKLSQAYKDEIYASQYRARNDVLNNFMTDEYEENLPTKGNE